MKISVRFTAAVHTLLCINFFEKDYRVTSDFIAASTGVHAVIIRKILLQLQKAGLVNTAAGVGGSHLAKNAKEINLLTIYNAINTGEDERELFNFHPSPNPQCPIGKNIHRVLDPALANAQKAMEEEMEKTTLSDLLLELNGDCT
ncbi:MAG: Rrf2 family transcriptional regulator [Treponema sp.]